MECPKTGGIEEGIQAKSVYFRKHKAELRKGCHFQNSGAKKTRMSGILRCKQSGVLWVHKIPSMMEFKGMIARRENC